MSRDDDYVDFGPKGVKVSSYEMLYNVQKERAEWLEEELKQVSAGKQRYEEALKKILVAGSYNAVDIAMDALDKERGL
jgi:hypothetical protein